MPGSNPTVDPARKGRRRRVPTPREDVDPVVANGFAAVADKHSVVSLAELSRRASAYLPPEELAERASDAGLDGYFSKPDGMDALITHIRQVLG